MISMGFILYSLVRLLVQAVLLVLLLTPGVPQFVRGSWGVGLVMASSGLICWLAWWPLVLIPGYLGAVEMGMWGEKRREPQSR